MASDWIKMRVDLADDPAVLAMSERLDIDPDTVVGKLHRFWSWTDKHTKDGRLPNVKTSWIDAHVRCAGFAKSVIEVGWLFENGDLGVTLPNFKKHNGKSAKVRADAALRQRKKRHKNVTKTCDKSVTREEKNRGEENREDLDPKAASKSKPKRSYSPAFERWWAAYPLKVAKFEASKAYVRAGRRIRADDSISTDQAVEKLQAACEAFAVSDQGLGEFCPHAATWLNRASYDDDHSAWKNRAPSATVRPALDLGDLV